MDVGFRVVGYWMFVIGVPFAYIIHQSFATQAEKLQSEVQHLEERAEASERLASAYFSIVQALSNAIGVRDYTTHEHVQRVHSLATAVGEKVGLSSEELEAVRFGAVLHDIGKIAVPDRILRKPGPLTPDEYRIIQHHTLAGETILRPIDFGPDVARVVRCHHEKLDGTGYPDGLAGDDIPMGARLLAAVDVCDALVSDRPYRKAWTSQRALQHLEDGIGTSFDVQVVEALAEAVEGGESVPVGGPSEDDPAGPALETLMPFLADDGSEVAAIASQAVELSRRGVLRGLTEFVVRRSDCPACVAYEVDVRNHELHATAASGDCAPDFHLVRMPGGTGPSAEAAVTQHAVIGRPAEEDFAAFRGDIPSELQGASVSAFPVVDPSGPVQAVVSVYGEEAATVSDRLGDEIQVAVALAGCQLEAIDEDASPSASA